jgi:hypothetical protein
MLTDGSEAVWLPARKRLYCLPHDPDDAAPGLSGPPAPDGPRQARPEASASARRRGLRSRRRCSSWSPGGHAARGGESCLGRGAPLRGISLGHLRLYLAVPIASVMDASAGPTRLVQGRDGPHGSWPPAPTAAPTFPRTRRRATLTHGRHARTIHHGLSPSRRAVRMPRRAHASSARAASGRGTPQMKQR